MSCSRQTAIEACNQAGGLGFITQKPAISPEELADVQFQSFLHPGRFVTCMVRTGSSQTPEEVYLTLHECVDGVEKENVLNISLDVLRKLEIGDEHLYNDVIVENRAEVIWLRYRRHPDGVALPREDLRWLIDFVHDHTSDLSTRGWFPVNACRQISWTLQPGLDTDRGWRIRLQIIDQRRQIGSIGLLPKDLEKILTNDRVSGIRVDYLEGGEWVALYQDGESAMLQANELRRALARFKMREASRDFPKKLRSMLIAWQDENRRIPSRKIARQLSAREAERRFPGSSYVRSRYTYHAEKSELWEELLARQDNIDEDLEDDVDRSV